MFSIRGIMNIHTTLISEQTMLQSTIQCIVVNKIYRKYIYCQLVEIIHYEKPLILSSASYKSCISLNSFQIQNVLGCEHLKRILLLLQFIYHSLSVTKTSNSLNIANAIWSFAGYASCLHSWQNQLMHSAV